ncbi:cysteine and histidine-rich domain-containing protein 1-like [Stylophora pistillata]|uniref:Cysteine and histidine-rich domain-containing protein 1 n=1 Tax=Stylophora pistillata TaxID=50429 RepID=A0A2B4SUW3_STYPI|nr:cysteine and histidine-rich domain-containing protein 1-like [Stylophora pistillata]PFX33671.1 Cysteine and histidine-rich domain-containing protein 1 [Stylophora pistillata]
MSTDQLLLCYNKGCGKKYKEDENGEDVCLHHPGCPVFHDALKGWSCCKKRVTDFTEFLNIKGCTKSCHTNVKPPEPEKPNTDDKALGLDEVIKVKPPKRKPIPTEPVERPSDDLPKIKLKMTVADSLKKALVKLKDQEKDKPGVCEGSETDGGIKPGTTCKNSGCITSYVDESTNDDKCWHHYGVPVFHEGYKFWSCCRKRTTDFDEFLKQEGCASGSHRWELTEEEKAKRVVCRYDWFKMGNFIVISVFAKLSDPQQTFVEANKTIVKAHVVFGGSNVFELQLNLHGVIIPEQSSVMLSQTKVEIKLRKEDIGRWPSLELKKPTEENPVKVEESK